MAKKQIYKKLIRDAIPSVLDAKGIKYEVRTLEEEDYKQALLLKLIEEVEEAYFEIDDREQMMKELCDVLEVIDAIKQAYGIDDKDIAQLKGAKKLERGGFEKRLFLEFTEES